MRRLFALLLIAALFLCGGCTPAPSDTSDGDASFETSRSETTYAPDAAALPNGTVRMHALNVGKADCLLLTAGDFHMLIDTGENETEQQMVAQLTAWGVTHIDLLLITHNDKDHVGGAEYLLQQMPVLRIIQADYDSDSNRYARYVAAAAAADVTRERLKSELTLSVGGAVIRLMPAARTAYEQENDYSILTEVTVGDRALLLMGDAEKVRLNEFVNSAAPKIYDLVKLPHHGSWNGATKDFLEAFCGEEVIISTSAAEVPEKKLTNWLESNERQVYYTYNGTVTVLTNGKTLTVTQDIP